MDIRSPLTQDSSYAEICARLTKLTTSTICDALPDVRLMDTKIEPVGDIKQCIGRVYPVDSAKDSISTMLALSDLDAFLSVLDPSRSDIVPTVLMIACRRASYTLAGGMCATNAKYAGFGAVVIDGPCRDIDQIKASGLAFFAKGKCAKSGSKKFIGTNGQEILFGGAKDINHRPTFINIKPGEIVFADIDGGVVMNKEEAVKAITKAEEIQAKEDIVMSKLKSGLLFNEIFNIDQHAKEIEKGNAIIDASSLRLI